MRTLTGLVLALGVLASAWSAGFFWTWSFTMTPGLAATPPEAAIVTMNAVNAGIRGFHFGFVFFGPLVIAVLLLGLSLVTGAWRLVPLAAMAILVYGVGVIGVTVAFSLPLNNTLAGAAVHPDTAKAIWSAYVTPWAAWNHLRTVAATATLGIFVWASLSLPR